MHTHRGTRCQIILVHSEKFIICKICPYKELHVHLISDSNVGIFLNANHSQFYSAMLYRRALRELPNNFLVELWPSGTILHGKPLSTMVQVITCRLIDAKPLPELMLTYRHLDLYEEILIDFFSIKCNWKCRLENDNHFVQALML